MPRIEEVEELDLDGRGAPYPIITGDYSGDARLGAPRRSCVGTPVAKPTPIFTKLDPSVVDEELARLAGDVPGG